MSEEMETTEIQVPDSAPVVPAGMSAEERQGLIAELQETRAQARRQSEELHQLRQVTLQNMNQRQQPTGDPVEGAIAELKKSNDPALIDATKGFLVPILGELNLLRMTTAQLQQGFHQVMQMQREAQIHVNLSQAIPDIDVLGPEILKELATYDQETREFYIRKPDQLRVLADKIRLQKGGSLASAKVKADRAKTGMDTGAADAQSLSKAESLKKMSEKDFAVEFDKWIAGS